MTEGYIPFFSLVDFGVQDQIETNALGVKAKTSRVRQYRLVTPVQASHKFLQFTASSRVASSILRMIKFQISQQPRRTVKIFLIPTALYTCINLKREAMWIKR